MPEGDLKSVELLRSGGPVPTYAPSFKVDVQQLSSGDQQALKSLVDNLDLSKLPDRMTSRGVPDAFEYTLIVKQDDTSRTIQFHDQDGHPQSLDALVSWLRARGNR
jgi:hypothetical protein